MSSKKTTQFPAASTLTGTEGVVQSGSNVQTTTQAIANIQPTADPVVIGNGASAIGVPQNGWVIFNIYW